MKIGYGNYGMPNTPYETMIRQVKELGYDGLEVCVGAAYPTAPDRLSSAEREKLRGLLEENGLDMVGLMMSGLRTFEPDAAQHAANLDLLKRVFALGNDLGVEQPVVIHTVGGQIDEWDTDRELLLKCVHDWAEVARECNGWYALEAHVGSIVNSPDRVVWVLEQVNNPHLKTNFDFSHFEFLDTPLADAIDKLLPYAVATHVKDTRGYPPNFRFLLPGEGDFDYSDYLQQMAKAGYDGYITVEISAQIFRAPGYDPLAAARFSYETLAKAFATSGVTRG